MLLQSSDVDLHCDITGNPNTEVQWLRPNGEKFDKQQVIRLKSVTSKEAGQWTCLVHDDKFYVTLTVVGWCLSVAVFQYKGVFYFSNISCC